MQELTDNDWQARAIAAERRADEAWQKYHQLAAEVESYKHESEKLHQLEHSISWKITSPLRFFTWLWRMFKANLPKLKAQRAAGR